MTAPSEPFSAERVADGRAWAALSERIASLGELVWGPDGDGPDGDESNVDPAIAAEGLRYLLRFLSAGIEVCATFDDPDHPELGRMVEDRRSWGLDNPDCLYSYARLDPAGRYELSGTRGSARHLEVQVNTGHFGDGDFAGWQTVSALSGDDLTLDGDGRFTITLSRVGTLGRDGQPSGDHLPLDERASFVLVRQYVSDWAGEEPATLHLERVDAPYPARPYDADRAAAQAALLDRWLDAGARCWQQLSDGLRATPAEEIQPFVPPASATGLKGLAYGFGGWRCLPDEAVIVEMTPPACRMWGLSLCDRFWQSIDFSTHQSSLNDQQAHLDPTGRFVGVITHDDPGVANWLDPAGNTEGTLAVRYLFADDLPPARLTTVARHELDAVLDGLDAPPRRITANERREVLRARRAAVVSRYRR